METRVSWICSPEPGHVHARLRRRIPTKGRRCSPNTDNRHKLRQSEMVKGCYHFSEIKKRKALEKEIKVPEALQNWCVAL